MAKTDNLTDFLTDVANAIRTKKGTTEPINPQDFSAEIASIQSGGGEFSWDFSRIGYTSENSILLQQFEDAIAYSEEKARTFTPSKATSHFKNDRRLVFVPMVDTSSVTSMNYMFSSCSALTSIPQLDTSSVTNMESMFQSCPALTTIPQLDTSNVTDMRNMFSSCSALVFIPQLDMRNVKNISGMFNYCYSLVYVPELDVSRTTNLSRLFAECKSLISIPPLDTSKVTDMSYIFDNCHTITSIPHLNTGEVTTMAYMFRQCQSLTSIPPLDTSKVTDIDYMFNNCLALTTISSLDMSSVTRMSSYVFISCKSLVFALFKNIGKSSLKTYYLSIGNWGTGGEENRQSLIDSLITYSYDRASNGMDTATIKLSSNTKALLTEEEIAQITAKGFTIA